MDCTRASDLIMAYFDGIKSDNEMELFQHIKDCNICAEEFTALEEVINSVEQLEEYVIPDNFEKAILDSIDLNKFAVTKRGIPTVLWVMGTSVAIAFVNIFIYIQYGSVDTTGIYRYFSSLTQFINFTTIVNRVLTIGLSTLINGLHFLNDLPMYFKGMIGAYFVILLLLCGFFVGIHLILIRLTTGQDV